MRVTVTVTVTVRANPNPNPDPDQVVITSGTLSPIEMYPRILGFTPCAVHSFAMSFSRNVICPLVVTRGADQVRGRVSARDRVRVRARVRVRVCLLYTSPSPRDKRQSRMPSSA